MFFRFLGKSWCTVLVLLVLVGTSGCRKRAVGRLLGQWEGHPDTAAARKEREAKKYGEEVSAELKLSDATRATDWESYDVGVLFDFVDRENIKMSLDDGSEPVSGKWRVLSTSPIGCTIEIKTENKNEETPSVVLRHFQIDWDEREGECVGFTLIEEGADRQLGTLYFQRTEQK